MNQALASYKCLFSLFRQGARAKTLIVSVFPVALGMSLARYEGVYDISVYLYTILTALFLQIGCNFANDYYDHIQGADTKNRIGPKRLSGQLKFNQDFVFYFMILSFSISALFCIPLIYIGGKSILLLLLLGIFLAIFYTKGKYSLANTGLSSLVVFIVFGPLATSFAYFFQTNTYAIKTILHGLTPGSLAMVLFAMNNLRDIDQDRNNNKKTFVVRFGFEYGKKESIFFLLFSVTIPVITFYLYNQPLTPLLLPLSQFGSVIAIIRKILKIQSPTEVIPLFSIVSKYIIVYSTLTTLAWRLAC